MSLERKMEEGSAERAYTIRYVGRNGLINKVDGISFIKVIST